MPLSTGGSPLARGIGRAALYGCSWPGEWSGGAGGATAEDVAAAVTGSYRVWMPQLGDSVHHVSARAATNRQGLPTGMIQIVRNRSEYVQLQPPMGTEQVWMTMGDDQLVLANLNITETIGLINNLAHALADVPGVGNKLPPSP